ncbi:type IV toxin-antitoxin system AbiEi family antitoxin domain-containing protein [Nesterenkonia ebinurensis]|uniref:type IV toxin-antitoxin system AbiEi family antitoxin domain-containing protein n=1 Tax=Nesterenkonia ebinurensis TaxID=2608252 RepID=UPI00123D55C3|nr:type IV toxin-antitoxin system AbiEi family antitoxin domain-containing protein [Nesterenkonia ebinurensis]
MATAGKLIDKRYRSPFVFVPGWYSRAELEKAGYSPNDLRHAVRNGTLHRVIPGVFQASTEQAPDPVWAKLRVLTREHRRVVSHSTAAAIWGLSAAGICEPYHVTVADRAARIQRPGLVRSHVVRVPEEFVCDVQGIRVAAPAWTWLDLALQSSEEDALVLADQVLATRVKRPGRPVPLAKREDLRAALETRGRTKGIRTARAALELAHDVADSPQETRLRYYCHLADLPEPVVNPLIGDAHGEMFFRPDLAFTEFKVAVQYEGQLYHSDPERVLKDVHRQEVTEALGWVEVRITKEHMRNGGAAAIRKIRAKLIERGWRS